MDESVENSSPAESAAEAASSWQHLGPLLLLLVAALAAAAGFYGARYFDGHFRSAPTAGSPPPIVLGDLPTADPQGKDLPGPPLPAIPREPFLPAGTPLPKDVAAAKDEVDRFTQRLLGDFPGVPDALEIKARALFLIGKADEAAAIWAECLKTDPNYAYAYVGLGRMAHKSANYEKAATLLRKALEITPASEQTQIDLANALTQGGRVEEAIEVLRKSVQSNPSAAESQHLLGMAYLQQDKLDKAREHYEAALKANPQHSSAQLGLANVYRRQGQSEKAKALMEKFQKLRAEERTLRQTDLRTYDDLDAIREESAILYTTGARLYFATRNMDDARCLLTRAAAMSPTNVEARQALAWLDRQEKKLPDAIRMLEELARLQPNNPLFDLEIGRLKTQLGQFDAAEALLENVRQRAAPGRRPGRTGTFVPAKRQEASQALALAQEAVKLDAGAENQALLAEVQQRNGDVAAAQKTLEDALAKDPQNAQLRALIQQFEKKR